MAGEAETGKETETGKAETGTEVEVEETEVKETSVPISVVQREREKSSSLQAKVDAYEAEKAEAAKAAMSDTERANTERDELKTKYEELEKKYLLDSRSNVAERAAVEAGFANPEDAKVFIDLSSVEGNTDEEVAANIKASVTQVLVDRPYLASTEEGQEPQKLVPGRVGGGSGSAGNDRGASTQEAEGNAFFRRIMGS